MSGIVGIVHASGAPVDQHLLQRLTDALPCGGPSASVNCNESVGFGCTRRFPEQSRGVRSIAVENDFWIVADARIDGRDDLRRALTGRGCTDVESANDEQLILHAYATWDSDCVHHLIGDYAFAIWDHRKRRLFCARDHFGIKPFYYSLLPDGIVFSNTLDCVRLHPQVAHGLDDESIADFLLLGSNSNWASTTFASIKRVPPAHTLTFSGDDVRLQRYWEVSSRESVRFRREHDHVDKFLELLGQAVDDRTPADRIGIWLSGGLDSAALAAIAQRQSRADGAARTVVAQAVVYDSVVPDDTRQYASLAATAARIPLACFSADGHQPFAAFDAPGNRTPEPNNDPFTDMRRQLLREAREQCQVWLCGEGADEILWPSRIADLLPSVSLVDIAGDVARSVVAHRVRPSVGLRSAPAAKLSKDPLLPQWLAKDLDTRYGLAAKWQDTWHVAPTPAVRTASPRAVAAHRLATTAWPWYFESFDPGTTRVPIETRYPFLDVRLVDYMMTVPPLPWCVDKRMLRLAMRELLPAGIVNRPKTPLGGDPLHALLSQQQRLHLMTTDAAPGIERYVDFAALRKCSTSDADDVWTFARALSLNYWLKYHVHVSC